MAEQLSCELGHTEDHHCDLYMQDNGEYRARCSCGATWTYDKSRSMAYMKDIYAAHLGYFNRPPTLVL